MTNTVKLAELTSDLRKQVTLGQPTCLERRALAMLEELGLERERWIPVEKRLPENGEEVLFVAEEKRLYGFRMDSAWYRLTGRTYYAPSVSHWRPLPAPPAPAEAPQ